MADCDSPAAHADRDCCPRCEAPSVALMLLTSMTRYFVCRHCHHRWQIAVIAADHGTGASVESR